MKKEKTMKKESVNIDKDFREKLATREITPSPAAWDRLDAMLTVAEKNDAKKPFRINFWLVAAAVSAVLLGIFFLTESNQKPVEQMVQTPQLKEEVQPLPLTDSVASQPRVLPAQPVVSPRILRSSPLAHAEPKTIQQETIRQEEIKAQTNQPQTVLPKPFTGPSADELLTSQPEVKSKRISINPSSLLTEVDGALERSFRERVLESVDERFRKARTALANRNNQ